MVMSKPNYSHGPRFYSPNGRELNEDKATQTRPKNIEAHREQKKTQEPKALSGGGSFYLMPCNIALINVAVKTLKEKVKSLWARLFNRFQTDQVVP